MTDFKFKIGDIVKTLADKDPYGNSVFATGSTCVTVEIDKEDTALPYGLQLVDIEPSKDRPFQSGWWYSEDMIELVDIIVPGDIVYNANFGYAYVIDVFGRGTALFCSDGLMRFGYDISRVRKVGHVQDIQDMLDKFINEFTEKVKNGEEND